MDAVGDDLKHLSREIEGVTVSEMSPVRKIHSQHLFTRLEGGKVYGHIGLAAGVRLNISVFGFEQTFGALDGERFYRVGKFAAAVIALPGETFSVLIGKYRTHRLQHRLGDEVF